MATTGDLTEVRTARGTLDRALTGPPWLVPGDTELDAERLVWNYVAMVQRNRRVQPRDGMLERFIELADGSAADVLRYARHYGVLMICEHGLPASHRPTRLFNQDIGCRPAGWGGRKCWEPLERWWHFARQARAMLHIANQLRRGLHGTRADWEQIYGTHGRHGLPRGLRSGYEKFLLGELLQEWLTLGDVHANVQWLKDELRPVITFRGAGLFGALAVQLALSVAGVDGWSICDACHRQYIPMQRRPKTGQRNFCMECRQEGVSKQYALRDYRERQRKERDSEGAD